MFYFQYRISSEVQPNEAISNENSSPTRLLPNPELFPYLSRRLASTTATIPDLALTAVNNSSRDRRPSSRSSSTSDAESLDDVDAAAAMLVLKHGHTVFNSPRKGEFQIQFKILNRNFHKTCYIRCSETLFLIN